MTVKGGTLEMVLYKILERGAQVWISRARDGGFSAVIQDLDSGPWGSGFNGKPTIAAAVEAAWETYSQRPARKAG